MPTQEVKRKLTAVLSADVQGFSRLMGEDEEGTHQRLASYRDVIGKLARLHHGRVVTVAGDGFLIEFASVVDALACAVETQREFLARNASLPEDKQMKFRIGINIGDVIEEDDQIFGDGVNIAARLQALAEGGGIYLSGQAYDQVKKRLALPYRFLGEKKVKNIADPVRVYRVGFDEEAAFLSGFETSGRRMLTKRHLAIAGVIAIVIAAGTAVWFLRSPAPPSPPPQVASTSVSIAVQPFTPSSKDPEEERLSLVISDAVADGLASIARFRVVYASAGKLDQPTDYALSGRIEKWGDRFAVRARLVDTKLQSHVWNERFEYQLGGSDEIQDTVSKVATAVMIALKTKLLYPEEELRHQLDPPKDPQAYELVQQGLRYMWHDRNFPKAEDKFSQAIKRDPRYASAYANLAFGKVVQFLQSREGGQTQFLDKAFEYAKRAVELNDKMDLGHVSLCYVYIWRREHDLALTHAKRAVEIIPYGLQANLALATSLIYSGKPQEAFEAVQKAEKLDPSKLSSSHIHTLYGHALSGMGRFEEAADHYRKAVDFAGKGRKANARACLIITLVRLGQEDEAKKVAAELKTENPDASVDSLLRRMPYRNPQELEAMHQAFKKAGF
jgi:adenylate cyclase